MGNLDLIKKHFYLAFPFNIMHINLVNILNFIGSLKKWKLSIIFDKRTEQKNLLNMGTDLMTVGFFSFQTVYDIQIQLK